MKSAGKREVSLVPGYWWYRYWKMKRFVGSAMAEQHAFAEVLIADVRVNVLPLRVGRIFRRLSGVEADVA